MCPPNPRAKRLRICMNLRRLRDRTTTAHGKAAGAVIFANSRIRFFIVFFLVAMREQATGGAAVSAFRRRLH